MIFPKHYFDHFATESLLVVFRINLRHLRWHVELSTHRCIFYCPSWSPIQVIIPVDLVLYSPYSLLKPALQFLCLSFVQAFIHNWIFFSICPNATDHLWLKSDQLHWVFPGITSGIGFSLLCEERQGKGQKRHPWVDMAVCSLVLGIDGAFTLFTVLLLKIN